MDLVVGYTKEGVSHIGCLLRLRHQTQDKGVQPDQGSEPVGLRDEVIKLQGEVVGLQVKVESLEKESVDLNHSKDFFGMIYLSFYQLTLYIVKFSNLIAKYY